MAEHAFEEQQEEEFVGVQALHSEKVASALIMNVSQTFGSPNEIGFPYFTVSVSVSVKQIFCHLQMNILTASKVFFSQDETLPARIIFELETGCKAKTATSKEKPTQGRCIPFPA